MVLVDSLYFLVKKYKPSTKTIYYIQTSRALPSAHSKLPRDTVFHTTSRLVVELLES